MRFSGSALLFVALTLGTVTVRAAALPSPAVLTPTEATIKATIEQRFPGHPVEGVHPAAALPGLYEVVTSSEIVYTTPKADVVLVGKLIDAVSHDDLSARRWNELHSIDFKSLPLASAIKTVRGHGTRVVAVFADPKCPYCQQLEQNIKDVDDVTIYTFLYPLENLHPGATVAAHEIWCAADSAATWAAWMTRGVPPAPAPSPCTTDPLESNRELGVHLDVNLTPTLFFADGSRFSGSMSAREFEDRLNEIRAKPGT
jgi:thiol:disulfide interchange protein DsbC